MELGEFQFVEKVDGRVVRRFEEKDVLMDQRVLNFFSFLFLSFSFFFCFLF